MYCYGVAGVMYLKRRDNGINIKNYIFKFYMWLIPVVEFNSDYLIVHVSLFTASVYLFLFFKFET